MIQQQTTTHGSKLSRDEALQQALDIAAARATEISSRINGIRPPLPDLEQAYQEAIQSFSQTRGGQLYFPFIGSGIGHGPFVELGDGSVKLDFINGIGAHPFGHSHPELMCVALQAAVGDTVMHGNLQQNAEGASFSSKLLSAANRDRHLFDHCFLSSTGVMAGENMLKIAFQARQPADRVLAFEGCFAGRTIAFSQITDKPAYREGLPPCLKVDYVPFFNPEDPEGSTEKAVATLKRHIQTFPDAHAAFIYELVQGEGGFYPGSHSFFAALMQACREHGILNLCDEVQTFARTTNLFAFQTFALEEWIDGVWIGKASQACATLFKSKHKPRPGLLSQTFTASAVALATGERIIDMINDGGYLGENGRIAHLQNYFHQKLDTLRKRHPSWISGPYGIGAMTAFTPFQGKPQQAKAIVEKLFQKGVMAFVAGAAPARVRFLWPVGVTQEFHIQLAIDLLEEALEELNDKQAR